ncbi:short-chain dehydrogenase [Lophiostoma macrostomum CBS 122681]|uniref:Short-chain dehydrogenase n=1 Tax=Lophiostoma macrostomum CBS 122681 TaxID=1314788 RepID=A0A6A6T971_9PLEO|nr:short-chain dehydrogenase [Lophiostoma macrostomum CBS 122681]
MSTFSQIFPPCPTFTEKSIVDLSTKVYIITGATAGVGLSLATMLYSLNATVYIGGRSSSSCETAITAVQTSIPTSKGNLKPFVADLSDLTTIKPAVTTFLSQEHRLDVLFLNAGIMTPPASSKTTQGYDLELGVNCLSSFLLVQLLEPTMANVARHFCHPNQSIRVVWVSSLLNVGTPDGGVQLDASGVPKQLEGMPNYMQSKAGVYLLAHEFASRQKSTGREDGNGSSADVIANEASHGNPFGVLHVSLNPGLMKTELQRHAPPPMRGIMSAVFKGPKAGAYTELYAGLAPGVSSGDYVIPWGRKGEVPPHVVRSMKGVDGQASVSKRFYEWCEQQVQPFVDA